MQGCAAVLQQRVIYVHPMPAVFHAIILWRENACHRRPVVVKVHKPRMRSPVMYMRNGAKRGMRVVRRAVGNKATHASKAAAVAHSKARSSVRGCNYFTHFTLTIDLHQKLRPSPRVARWSRAPNPSGHPIETSNAHLSSPCRRVAPTPWNDQQGCRNRSPRHLSPSPQ